MRDRLMSLCCSQVEIERTKIERTQIVLDRNQPRLLGSFGSVSPKQKKSLATA